MDNKVHKDILALCVPILTALFVPHVVAMFKHYWSQADLALEQKAGTQWNVVKSIVTESVKAAEQAGVVKAGEDLGQAKLQYATKFVQETLAARGINLDLYPIVQMIEAAVMEEFGKDKLFVQSVAEASAPQAPKVD